VLHERDNLVQRVFGKICGQVFPGWLRRIQRRRQGEYIDKVYRHLAHALPDIDVAVVGIASGGGLCEGIKDMRKTEVDVETEKEWCRRYSISHLVIGVHGSNMILPSAFAGGSVVLMPDGYALKLTFTDTAINRESDGHRMSELLRYRTMPTGVPSGVLAQWIGSTLTSFRRLCEIWRM
jgi:hypothetical protein